MLDLVNEAVPFEHRRNAISAWRAFAAVDVSETNALLRIAQSLAQSAVQPKDALHVAAAISAGCELSLTTDESLLKKGTIAEYDKSGQSSPMDHSGGSTMTDTEVRTAGVKALVAAPGEVQAEKFAALVRREPFDYTEWQQALWLDKSLEQISTAVAAMRKPKA